MSGEVPEGWRLAKLGEIAALSGGTTPSKSIDAYWMDGAVPWATPSDITSLPMGQTRIAATETRITDLALKECSLKLNATGTVLMTSRATIGYAAINDVPMATNQGFLTFTSFEGCDPDFLCQWLNANRRALTAAAGGSTFKELSRGTAKLLPLLLPPLDEQQRIAEVLLSVDEAITLAGRAVDQAELALASARAQLTGQDGSEPDWTLQPVIDCFQLQRGHDLPVQNRMDGSVPVIASNGPVGFHDHAPIPTPAVITGRSGTIGKVSYLDGPCWPLNTTLFIRDFKGSNPRFVYHFLSAFPLAQHATGTGVPTLNRNDVHAVEVSWPERGEQNVRAEILDSLETAWLTARAALEANRTLKVALANDLLSGCIRVPAFAPGTSSKPHAVQPAFKRAVFAAEVVYQLHNDNRFGSVKHEKIVHLCELHLRLQDDLDRHAYKEAAGPYDPSARRSVERIFRQQKWFDPTKQDKRIVYQPLDASGGHARYFDRYFGDRKAEVQKIIDLLRPLTTQQCEIIATLYAVWNDYLIDGRQPDDDEIVDGVLNDWTDSKRQIPEEKWRAALPWMRQRGLIPAGHGEKTRVAST